MLTLIDPNSLRVCELRSPTYFDTPFTSLCDAKDLQEFYIIDITPEGPTHGKFVLATAVNNQ